MKPGDSWKTEQLKLPVEIEDIKQVSFQWFNMGEQQKYPAIQVDKIVLYPSYLRYDLALDAMQAYCHDGYSISPGDIVKLHKCGVPQGWKPYGWK